VVNFNKPYFFLVKKHIKNLYGGAFLKMKIDKSTYVRRFGEVMEMLLGRLRFKSPCPYVVKIIETWWLEPSVSLG